MIDYSIYYRRSVATDRISKEIPEIGVFISAYNSSDRVLKVFEEIAAKRKVWLIHPEYGYTPMEEPTIGEIVRPTLLDEVAQVNSLLAVIGDDLSNMTICIDITGFMRHVLVFLMAKLDYLKIKNFYVIYSEPVSYSKAEDTVFTTKATGVVRPVRGIGASNVSNAKDHLIIGVGFDAAMISLVSHHKDDAVTYPLFAFPSLSADMYQQSTTNAAKSGEIALQMEWIDNRVFSPANDPFATAGVVSNLVSEINLRNPVSNIYLSPLSTKAQALGFSLYWLLEGRIRGGVSILLPECETYARETSAGFKRLWLYTVELD